MMFLKNLRNAAILGSSLRMLTVFKTHLRYICISKLIDWHTNICCDSAVTVTLTYILEDAYLQVSDMGIGTMSYSSQNP